MNRFSKARPGSGYADVAIFFGRPGRSAILAQQLRSRGFQVTLYSNQGRPGAYVPLRNSFVPILIRVLTSKHQVYWTPLSFIPSICLCLNRMLRRRPCVLNATGLKSATYQDRSKKWPFRRAVEGWLYPSLMNWIIGRADRIVCNSRYLQKRLESESKKNARKISTIYNGIEFERFSSGPPASIGGIAARPPTLVAVMTWNYKGKADGAKLLIDSMGLILRTVPESRLIIAAKTMHDGYAQEIEAYLAATEWHHAITILYNQKNIPDLLANSDVFVYATAAESNDSLPRVLLEAHAAGLPIVTTATSGCPEIVEDAVTGFVIPYAAPSIAQRVIELLADPVRRQEMGRLGRERVGALFNWNRMGQEYANLFSALLATKHTAAGKIVTRAGQGNFL